jgi:hypothetical protein
MHKIITSFKELSPSWGAKSLRWSKILHGPQRDYRSLAWPCTQEPTTGPYPDPHECSPHQFHYSVDGRIILKWMLTMEAKYIMHISARSDNLTALEVVTERRALHSARTVLSAKKSHLLVEVPHALLQIHSSFLFICPFWKKRDITQ